MDFISKTIIFAMFFKVLEDSMVLVLLLVFLLLKFMVFLLLEVFQVVQLAAGVVVVVGDGVSNCGFWLTVQMVTL